MRTKKTVKAGWVKINGESDLPNRSSIELYFILRHGLNTPFYKGEYYEEEKEYWLKNYEYYKPVKIPLPPRLI